MAPASRSSTAARAKSAKSAGQDYVLRNKPKRVTKKTAAPDKSLDDLPGETLVPPDPNLKPPGGNVPTASETSPAAPAPSNEKESVGDDATEPPENINDLLNSINNPTNADGEDDVEMAPEEETAKDPAQAAADSPSSSPVKKKKKSSSAAAEPNKSGGDAEKEKKRKAKKDKTKISSQPASVLKTGKLGSGSRLSFADAVPKATPPHVHKHKSVIVEINVDLAADALSQFEGDNNKKAVYAIQQLVVNLMIADKHAVILHAEDPSLDSSIGGAGGNAVPTNMTALSNYVKGFNPKPFSNNHPYEPQGGQARGRRQGNLVYGWISISCDKDPEALTQQLSYEWSKFGNRICVKELQSGSTLTAFIVWYSSRHIALRRSTWKRCVS